VKAIDATVLDDPVEQLERSEAMERIERLELDGVNPIDCH
jgi:hypothetical protein